MKDLSFSPVSLCVSGDYAVAGGQWGELALHSMSLGTLHTLSLGSSINNAVCISPPGRDRVLVSSNDYCVRVLSLPDLLVREVIHLPAPVNHASASADGARMAACGDMDTVFLFDIRQGKAHSKVELRSTWDKDKVGIGQF